MRLMLLLSGLLLLSGCCQLAESGFSEIGTCMEKCQDVCDAAKDSGVELDGYNVIGLQKTTGSMTVSCECPC
jgi:hypothetical protein